MSASSYKFEKSCKALPCLVTGVENNTLQLYASLQEAVATYAILAEKEVTLPEVAS